MAYSIDAITDGCYPGTTCLINKLGIQDESVLAETEAAVTETEAPETETAPEETDPESDNKTTSSTTGNLSAFAAASALVLSGYAVAMTRRKKK